MHGRNRRLANTQQVRPRVARHTRINPLWRRRID
jgi:hypothetical protein